MYLIMTLVNAMVILVVAFMSGMLSNIYFTQRITEFAILSAIGVKRRLLLWHAVSETAILTGVGWMASACIVTWGLLSFLKGHAVRAPRHADQPPRSDGPTCIPCLFR